MWRRYMWLGCMTLTDFLGCNYEYDGMAYAYLQSLAFARSRLCSWKIHISLQCTSSKHMDMSGNHPGHALETQGVPLSRHHERA